MRELLIALLDEFHENLARSQNSVHRNYDFAYMPNKIKVAIGMRRSGKTFFLLQLIKKILQQDVNINQILFINFEDDRLLPCDSKTLASLIEEFYSMFPENHDKVCYLFLDEIQNVLNWPLVIRRFQDSKNVQIYLSGSSSKLLSKDLHTALRGRSISREIWPFSFNEYLHAINYDVVKPPYPKRILDQLFQYLDNYLINGGFPETINIDPLTRRTLLQDYVDLVLVKDVIERYAIQNSILLKYLAKNLLKNNASLFSVNKFTKDLKSQGIAGSKSTVHEYLGYLEDAYLIFPVNLYSESLRKVQANSRKIYAVDPGLVHAYTFSRNHNYGHLFENMIYLLLRYSGHKIYYYLTEQDRYEVDFLTQTPKGDLHLFQVCWDIQDQTTLERETRALNIAKQELNIDGTLITPNIFMQEYLYPNF